jgi:asparagine synthase (glutamine-hydrolysing)
LEIEPVPTEDLWDLEPRLSLPHSPDTPFVGWRTCYAEVFRRMRARGSRVLLMGHGGDDVLRGSSRIYFERLLRGDLAAVREVVRDALDRRESVSRSVYRQFVRPLLPARGDRRTARQEVFAHLVETPWYWRLANWHDRNAAGFGIEVRNPFLDRRLFEYVLSIPGEQIFRLGRSKDLLRRSMRGILPEAIRLRKEKTSFLPFLDLMLRERAAGEVQELLRAPRAAALGVVDGKHLQSIYLDVLDGGSNESRRTLWYAITLEIWLERCEVIRRSRRRVLRAERAAA